MAETPADRDDAPGDAKPSTPVIPLVEAVKGQHVVLVRADGGHRFQHRLAEMGLLPGTRFEILAKAGPGPAIIRLKGARLMLGRGMIHRIWVAPV